MPTEKEVITDLQQVADELGETPTVSDYDERGEWNSWKVQTLFGKWNDAIQAAGLPVNNRQNLDEDISYFTADLQRVSEIAGRVPRRGDVNEHGKHNPTTYQQRVPDNGEKSRWSEVLRVAGFEPHWEEKDTRTTDCEICGEQIEVKEYRKERRFCSIECHGKWREGRFTGEDNWTYNRQSVECDWCGESMERIQYHIENNERHFCDDECQGKWVSENNRGKAHPMYKDGSRTYGKGWSKGKRESVRERDGYECQVCGKSQEKELEENNRKLSVHHIMPARKFDDPVERNDESNLVTLCHRHHMIWEGIPLRPQTV